MMTKKVVDNFNDKIKEANDKLEGNSESDSNEEKGNVGSGKSNPNFFKTLKLVFKSGVIIGAVIIVACIIMALVITVNTVVGSTVQIIDGTIYDYGEPKEKDKDKKSSDSSAHYDSDEYYTKAKMIVQAVQNNPDLKKKVDNIKVPNGTYSIVRNTLKGKRGGIYHAIEVAYIFRELSLNDFCSEYKRSDGEVISMNDRFLWSEFIQENACGGGYEVEWDSNNDTWLAANTIIGNGKPYNGAFQIGSGYYGKSTYRVFIPSLEADNGKKYGVVCKINQVSKYKLGYNKKSRENVNANLAFPINVTINKDTYKAISSGVTNVYWHFSDNAATTANGMFFQGSPANNLYDNFLKVVKKEGTYAKDEETLKLITHLSSDMVHRGPGYFQFNVSNGKPVATDDSCSNTSLICAELLVDGLLKDENMDKIKFTNNYQSYKNAKSDYSKLVKLAEDKNTLGLNFGSDWVSVLEGGTSSNPELKASPVYKMIWGYQAVSEMKALINVAFDELKLELPDGNGFSAMSEKEIKKLQKLSKDQGRWKYVSGNAVSTYEAASAKGRQWWESNMVTVYFKCWNYADSKGTEKKSTKMKMTVNKWLLPVYDAIFTELYNDPFKPPLYSAGCFCWRHNANNSSKLSVHSFGIAVDLNSQENPNGTVPYTSKAWEKLKERDKGRCFSEAHPVVKTFKKYGFHWGGNFSSTKDGMHFQFCFKN